MEITQHARYTCTFCGKVSSPIFSNSSFFTVLWCPGLSKAPSSWYLEVWLLQKGYCRGCMDCLDDSCCDCPQVRFLHDLLQAGQRLIILLQYGSPIAWDHRSVTLRSQLFLPFSSLITDLRIYMAMCLQSIPCLHGVRLELVGEAHNAGPYRTEDVFERRMIYIKIFWLHTNFVFRLMIKIYFAETEGKGSGFSVIYS